MPESGQVLLWGYEVLEGRRELRADITDLITGVSAEFAVGQVPQLSVTLFDMGSRVSNSELSKTGTVLQALGQTWDVAAIDFDKGAAGTTWTIQARSSIARRLRRLGVKPPHAHTSATKWVESLAQAQGAQAHVQPSSKKAGHVESSAALGVIAGMAESLGWNWAQWGKKIVFADPHYAWQNDIGLPRYPLTWLASGSSDALSFSGHLTDDDAATLGTASAELPLSAGSRLRPYMTLDASDGFEPVMQGPWFVESVSIPVAGSDAASVQVELSRPRKGKPQPPPSVDTSGGERADALGATMGEPVKGSSFSDAPIPHGWRGRSVNAIYQAFQANPRGLKVPCINTCLWTAQQITGYPHEGRNPNVLWPSLSSTRKSSSKAVPPGAVMLWHNGHVGHATVYMGGGKTLSTDADHTGKYVPNNFSICPADALAQGFGLSWMGWYRP